MAVTETIQELLQGIDDAQYGRDMRQYIHKGIQKCYEEGSAGETDLVARQRLDALEDDIINPPDFSALQWKENWTTSNGSYETDYTVTASGWYMFNLHRLAQSSDGAQLVVSLASDNYAIIASLGVESASVVLTSQWLYFSAGDEIHVMITGDGDTRCDLAYAPCLSNGAEGATGATS